MAVANDGAVQTPCAAARAHRATLPCTLAPTTYNTLPTCPLNCAGVSQPLASHCQIYKPLTHSHCHHHTHPLVTHVHLGHINERTIASLTCPQVGLYISGPACNPGGTGSMDGYYTDLTNKAIRDFINKVFAINSMTPLP